MNVNDTVLIVIDVQGKLATLVDGHEHLFTNIERVVHVAQILDIPVLWTEQAPEKLGGTVEPIAQLLSPYLKPIPKHSFSCYACPEFRASIDALGRPKVLVMGIEAHVCVYQTARDLLIHGYDVYVLEDAVSSRTRTNKDIAIGRMRDLGIAIVSAEMVACELLKSARHPKFKDVMAHIKR